MYSYSPTECMQADTVRVYFRTWINRYTGKTSAYSASFVRQGDMVSPEDDIAFPGGKKTPIEAALSERQAGWVERPLLLTHRSRTGNAWRTR